MKKLFLLLSLISYTSFAQSKIYKIDQENSIMRIYKDKNLKFVVNYKGILKEYNYGFFEADTTLLNEKAFIIQKGNKIQLRDILNIDNTFFKIQIADWKNNYYLFQFSDKGNGIEPLYLIDNQIQSGYRRIPYEYYNEDKHSSLYFNYTIEEDEETTKPMIEVGTQNYFRDKAGILLSISDVFYTLQEYLYINNNAKSDSPQFYINA